MRPPWVTLAFTILLTCGAMIVHAQARPIPTAREIADVARTNLQAALDLCDLAVANNPTNAQPLLWRAQLLDKSHRYDDGIRDLTAALKLGAAPTVTLQRRGELHFKASRFKESVADFDRVIELAPDQGAHHWQRGISLFYANRFAEGRQQFEQHQGVNANDVENLAWHFLCAARETSVAKARGQLLRVGPDTRVPMREIDELYRGSGSPEQVLAAARRSAGEKRDSNALFYAHLYLGLYFDVLGERTKARDHIEKAAGEFAAEHYMGDVARIHKRQLTVK